jgi:hypothetical protein
VTIEAPVVVDGTSAVEIELEVNAMPATNIKVACNLAMETRLMRIGKSSL